MRAKRAGIKSLVELEMALVSACDVWPAFLVQAVPVVEIVGGVG